MRCGKTPGTKWKKERSHNTRDEERREGRINACFFYDLPYLHATAGYFVSKRITFAMCTSAYLSPPQAPNLLHPFLSRYYRSPLFRSSLRIAFTKGDAPTSGITNSFLDCTLRDLPLAAEIHGGKTYKAFPARFLPSGNVLDERGSGSDASRRI